MDYTELDKKIELGIHYGFRTFSALVSCIGRERLEMYRLRDTGETSRPLTRRLKALKDAGRIRFDHSARKWYLNDGRN